MTGHLKYKPGSKDMVMTESYQWTADQHDRMCKKMDTEFRRKFRITVLDVMS